MHATRRTRTGPGGFTLVELLVVITIIALISAVALPTILPALNERRVSESARVLQAALAGTRDAAIRANAPRGIRLLPDPVLNGQYPNGLASNRYISIEPGPDYTEGLVIAVPAHSSVSYYANLYALYNGPMNGVFLNNVNIAPYLIIAESDFSSGVPNNPTSWSLNVRQGDKIRFNDSGAYYTIAGPVNGPPFGPQSNSSYVNSERVISCSPNSSVPLASQTGWLPEFLFLTNGVDDNGNGWIDESCDGIDNDGDGITDPGFNGIDDGGIAGVIDDPAEMLIGRYPGAEFEQEVFIGSQASSPPNNEPYTIVRRPVVSPGARETTLPAGVVVDLTAYNVSSILGTNFLPERSRLPVDPFNNYVDIMIDQSGRVITPGAGSDGGGAYKNSPLSSAPFYHFWLTEREDVVAPPTTAPQYPPLLPLPKGTLNYTPLPGAVKPYLTGERRLVTLFVKTGQIVSNSIQNFSTSATPNFDPNAPFYDAQSGIKEPL